MIRSNLSIDPNPTLKLTGQANCIQVGITAYDSGDAQSNAAVDDLSLDQKIAGGKEMIDTAGHSYHSTPDDYARRETADGYVLEWRIPFKYINKAKNWIRPVQVGLQFGSAININDSDSTGRLNAVNWSAGHKDACWNTPKYDGTVTLLDGHKCKYEAKSLQVDTIVNPNEIEWYFGGTVPTSVKSLSGTIKSFKLMQNYPNPFNPTTSIEFSLPARCDIRLELVNVLGQVVKEIADGNYSAGNHSVSLDASHLASGIYFYRLQAGSFSDTKKLLLLK